MSTTDDVLAALEHVITGVPGVAELYRARPTVTSAVQAVRGLTTGGTSARFVVDGDVLRVVIGTDGVRPAPDVACDVHDVVLDAAAEHGLPLSRVDVRVARVG